MQYENINEAKTPLKSMITRSHAYIRLLVEKSMADGIKFKYHNGRRLTQIDDPERVVSQIFPYFFRLVFLEISTYYGQTFDGLKFHSKKRATGTLQLEVSILEDKIPNQLEFFTFISYVFNYGFLKNQFHEDLTLLTKATKFAS